MAHVSNTILRTCVGVALLAAGLFATAAAEVAPPPSRLAREDRALKAVCSRCHNLQIVMDTPRSYDDWHDTVQKMVDQGANATDEQLDDVMNYLHRTVTTINVNSAPADELEMVLNVAETTVQAIIARRSIQKFAGLTDLKSIPGVDASTVDAKARLIFFK